MLILFPQTSILLARKLCCTTFEDNEAVIKMITKGRSPTMRHVSRTHRVALDWLFDRINLDPMIQIWIHWHQESTRRHTDEGKIHTWWMESSFVFVQHQPFQFHRMSWSDVEKNAGRCRWRKSHSKIKADDEFGITIPREGSKRACLDCIGKPGEYQIWKSERTSVLVKCAANKYGETRIGR